MSKQAAKSELQKLKTLTDTTEVWSRRVHKFWKSTADICLAAAESFHADKASTSHLRTHLGDYSESACKCAENVKDVAQQRLIELSRSFQEKAKSKNKNNCHKELGHKVEAASVEISAAVFATFQNQADQLDLLLHEVMSFQRQQLASSEACGGRNSLESKKRDVSSDENNVELDWDAFDRDLAAVANVVDKMGQSNSDESEQIQKLKKQLKQTQRENSELMRRAILAEHALGNSERCNSELMESLDNGFNHDDFLEVRKALKQEQIARLDAEQRLKDAEEEIKAAQFAFKVAKAVANRIADSAEITQGSLLRCQSERQMLDVARPITNAVSAGIPDLATTSESDQEVREEMPVPRTDSAYFPEGHEHITVSDINLQPQSPSQESLPPIYDLPEETNPFMEDSEVEAPIHDLPEETNPFMDDSEAEADNPFLDPELDLSNPFLTGGESEEPSPRKEEVHQSPFDGLSNPFLTDSEVNVASTTDWNPFETSASSNPFLS